MAESISILSYFVFIVLYFNLIAGYVEMRNYFIIKKTHIILIQLQERYNLIYFVIRYEKFYITIFKRIRFLAIFIHYLY